MKILVAGQFDPHYNRSRVIFDGLELIPEIEVSYYRYTGSKDFDKKKFKQLAETADVVFIPSFCHRDVSRLRYLTKKPIVFDPLISRYLTKVFDYKTISPYSIRALKNYLKDKIAMSLADMVVCDTKAHLNYFKTVIGINENKLRVLPVGVNTADYFPMLMQKETSFFDVGFYGSFIPLQGCFTIIEAARLLEKEPAIRFHLIGDGFDFEKVKFTALEKYKLTNISFPGWLNGTELNLAMNQFDCCLGIFGETKKADLVIPNKVYHYAALKKPIITKRTTGILEVFTDKKDALLVEGSPESIAAAILQLKNDEAERKKLGENTFNLITGQYNHIEIARKLVAICREVMNGI
ncbi:glycosyltransferase [Flavihumibacter sp. UBA7668]|uniref:glycosyltransferase n=1 Tax=Flavihumibacter sp. UBA7668 TaxID=1946542 RepID=UPI0025C31D4A|nr:glycosyltransferase [Flavihumibacter sp. UBA7668]